MLAQARNRALTISCLDGYMAGKVAGAAKGGIRAWLMPELNDIKVQLAEMRGDMKSLNTRIDSTNTKLEEMDKRLSENDRRLSEKIDDLDKRLDIVQRLSVLEAKVREKEKNSA